MGVQINGDTGNVIATKGTFSGDVGIGGTLTYEDVTNIDSVGLVTARSGIEVGASPGVAASISVDGNMIVSGISTFGGDVQISSGGKLGIGTVTPSGLLHTHAASGTNRNYIEASAGHANLRIKSGSTSHNSGVEFFSGSSNTANVSGLGAGGLQFEVGGSERLRIASDGSIGIAGANYGTSGQVLSSQGSGSAVQWASAPTWTQQSIVTQQSGSELEFTSIPSTAREIMIRFDGISFANASNELEFILGNSGGYVTSGYLISASFEPGGSYTLRTTGITFSGVGAAAYIVTGRIHLWYPVHSANWWVEGVAFPSAAEANYQHRVVGQANSGGTLTKIKMQGSAGANFDGTGNGKVQLSYLTY